MNRLFANFRNARVLVVGDVMLDEYLIGNATRISPEAPVPIVEVTGKRYAAGGAANVAANATSLGARVTLLGLTGRDAHAALLRETLQNSGVDPGALVATDRPTICKTRVVSGQQQIVRFDVEERSALSPAATSDLLYRFRSLLPTADLCIVSDYGKGVISEAFSQAAIAEASKQNKPVIVDPKGRDYRKYAGCTLLTPNQKEAALATGFGVETEDDILAAGKSLLASLPNSSVLITRGPDGMTLFRPKAKPFTISTEARAVFDVVGAGDTAIAALGVGLAAGLALEIAVTLSNIAAGIAVGKHGTVAVTLDDLSRHSHSSAALRAALSGKLCA